MRLHIYYYVAKTLLLFSPQRSRNVRDLLVVSPKLVILSCDFISKLSN